MSKRKRAPTNPAMYPPNPKDDLAAADGLEETAMDSASDIEDVVLEKKPPIYVYEGTFLIKD
jgi:hypothetical protein